MAMTTTSPQHYSWDETVPNARYPAVGDLVILRDSDGSLGFGWLEALHEGTGRKQRRKCPVCGTSQLEQRKTVAPPYRCRHGHVFADPEYETLRVDVYRGWYARSFQPMRLLTPPELEELCLARSRQNAIRELDIDKTLGRLRDHGIYPSFLGAGPA